MELVQSICSEWERGDYDSVEWAHAEIDFAIVDGPAPGEWTGLAGMAQGWRGWLSAWDGFRQEADEYREIDDERVLVLFSATGRGKSSGLEFGQMQMGGAGVFHVRDGAVTRFAVYFDRGRALADLGLRDRD